jgi:pimeloyl-ACP methyl ester carboxylesterase
LAPPISLLRHLFLLFQQVQSDLLCNSRLPSYVGAFIIMEPFMRKLPLFVLAFSCITPSFVPLFAQSLPPDSQLPFARAQQMVDIGGRRLNLYCSGAGPVTVVFDAFSGGSAATWFAVQPHVARHARACVYDRAGLGFSDPSPRPGTSSNAVDDLHTLLGKAGIAPPYVMVGSSFGGGNVQLYAYRYPGEVKGMVLVEPQHEDAAAREARATGGKTEAMRAMQQQMLAACVAQSEQGFVPGSELWNNCIGPFPPGRGRVLGASEIANSSSAAYWKANKSEEDSFAVGGNELRAARAPFGGMPLIVLSRGVSPYAVPGKPQSALNKALEDENQKMMQEVAALSTRGSLRRVQGAGHIIHDEKPMAVVGAIEEVLAAVKK